jgi:hypothetical protein
MAFQKVEYTFPDEENKKPNIEVEDSSAVEIDISGKSKKEVVNESEKNKKEIKSSEETPNESNVEIEVVDDTPKADRNRKVSEPPEDVTDEELEDYSEKVKKRIQHFSKGYHDERRAKEAAFREREELEKFAKSLQEENNKLKGSVNKNQTALLEQAKKTTNIELEQAKKAYKTAYEAGDSDAILAAQESLTAVKIKSDKLNNFKIPSLQQEETPVEQETSSPTTEAPVADARAKDWASQNTWFGQDEEMTSLALGLHNKLAKQGMDLQSDEYYEAIDTRMRQLFPEKFEDIAEPEAEKPKRQANVVAPATRSIAPKKVKLTQTQVAIAKRLGVPIELYAQKVAEEMRKANG